MRKLNHGIAAAALSLPLVLGGAGVAAAASYDQHNTVAGPEGTAVSNLSSGSDNGSGGAFFEQQHSVAGPNGAASSSTEASTDDGYHVLDLSEHGEGLLGLGVLGL